MFQCCKRVKDHIKQCSQQVEVDIYYIQILRKNILILKMNGFFTSKNDAQRVLHVGKTSILSIHCKEGTRKRDL